MESLNHSKWECKYFDRASAQVSSDIHSKMPQKSAVWAVASASWQSVPRTGKTKGEPDYRGAFDARPRSYADASTGSAQVAIPPKYAVSQVVGYIKGKSAIHLARVYGESKRNFTGQHFWARGYFVSTVGRDETVIREYIRHQEQEDTRLDQMHLWRWPPPLGGRWKLVRVSATIRRFERLTNESPRLCRGIVTTPLSRYYDVLKELFIFTQLINLATLRRNVGNEKSCTLSWLN